MDSQGQIGRASFYVSIWAWQFGYCLCTIWNLL